MNFLTTQRSSISVLENAFMKWAIWDAVSTPYKQTYTTKPKPFALSHCETAGVNFGDEVAYSTMPWAKEGLVLFLSL